MLYSFEDKFKELIIKDNTNESDIERKSLFYILAGNDDLYRKVNYIYDFDERMIEIDCLENEEVNFSSGSKKLINLAFNLYNGTKADVLTTFKVLDDDNFELALNAIKFRFNKLDIDSSVIENIK